MLRSTVSGRILALATMIQQDQLINPLSMFARDIV
jgi:hypothetical protein